MKRLIRACSTSVGKKYLMAVTGLLLTGFLVFHLAGNLLLYADSTGKAYNAYAHTLHENAGLLLIAEIGLFGLFGLHIWLAFQTSRENRVARKHRYFVKESKIKNRLSPFKPETWMLISGLFVLAFLVLHLTDFRFERRPDIPYQDFEGNEFALATTILKTPLSAVVYLVGCGILGFHLAHGISSAFQSLGWNHAAYERIIHWAGVILAVLLGIGFVSFPIYFFMLAN